MFRPVWYCLLRACWQIIFNFFKRICLLIFPLPSLLTDRLPFQDFVKFLDKRNGKSKSFFTINNYYVFNFTLYSIYSWIVVVICKTFFYAKTFPNWTFEKCIKSSIFFNFWNPSQMAFTFSKQWKHQFVKYVKYVWNIVQNLVNNKSTRTTWVMLFWCLYWQLQRCGYWRPSWI